MFEPQATLSPNDAHIAAKVMDGETIILNVSNSNYYSTMDVGTTVWEFISSQSIFEDIVDGVLGMYDVSREQAQQDIQKFIADMVTEDLVLVTGDKTPHTANSAKENSGVDTNKEKRDYAPPVLDKFSDMADLLALDPPAPGLMDIDWKPDHTG